MLLLERMIRIERSTLRLFIGIDPSRSASGCVSVQGRPWMLILCGRQTADCFTSFLTAMAFAAYGPPASKRRRTESARSALLSRCITSVKPDDPFWALVGQE